MRLTSWQFSLEMIFSAIVVFPLAEPPQIPIMYDFFFTLAITKNS